MALVFYELSHRVSVDDGLAAKMQKIMDNQFTVASDAR